MLHPHKTIVVQRIHGTYHETKLYFVNWYYYSVHDEKIDPTFFLLRSEIWFQLNGYVKPHNNIFNVNQ